MKVERVARVAVLAMVSLVGGGVLISCGGQNGDANTPDQNGGANTPEGNASITLALINVPSDALCMELAVTPAASPVSAKTQLFAIAPGTSPILAMEGLPGGAATITARVFGVACAQVQATTTPTWVTAAPVAVALVAGQTVSASIVLRRPGGVQITATFQDGDLVITPNPVDFGSVGVDTPTNVVVTLSNPGTTTVTMPTYEMTGPDAAMFGIGGGNCSNTLAPGASCVTAGVFRPTSVGTKTATLVIGAATASFTGKGIPALVLTPNPVDFGSVGVDTPTNVVVTLSNPWAGTVTIPTYEMTGPDAAMFGIGGGNCSNTLAPGASCVTAGVFRPTSVGTKTATLVFGASTASFTGKGIPALVLTPNPVDFGSVGVDTPTNVVVTLSNPWAGTVTIPTYEMTGPDAAMFGIGGGNCSNTLAPGASCVTAGVFRPTSVGTKTATLVFGASTASFTGKGIPALVLTPNPVDFGSVGVDTPTNVVITLSNPWAGTVTIPTYEMTGPDAAMFGISGGNCGNTLAPGASCVTAGVFRPTSVGTKTATLVFGASTASLTGTGISTIPALTLSPSAASFGSVVLNTTANTVLTLSNPGTATVTLPMPAITGTDASMFALATGGNCSTTLAPAASCVVAVVFTPTTVGTKTATLAFGSAAASLTGTGTSVPAVTLSPSPVDFGGVGVNTTANTVVTLSNPGTTTISVPTYAITGPDAAMFGISGGNCGNTLAPGASCVTTAVFSPTTVGTKTATLAFGSTTASLTGTAVSGALLLSPSPLAFGSVADGTSSSLTLTLTNSAAVALDISATSMVGNTSDFALSAGTCGAKLNPAGSCTRGVTFTPSAPGARSVTLSIGGSSVSLTGTGTLAAVYRIESGNSSSVSPFAADQYYSGGTAHSVSNAINTSVTNAAPQAVYQSERYGNSTYTFPNLTAGVQYTVRLHFAEIYQTGTGKRVFDVAINGATVLSRFDIYAAAGANYKAVVRDFTTTPNASKQIVIALTTVTDNASIAGIEILR